MAKKPGKIGRPSQYDPDEHPKAARLLVGNGKTLADMAEIFAVERHAITRWQEAHPEFRAAIELGREDATDRVERALLERATGYTWPSEKIVVVSDGAGAGSHVERVKITEHVPPDPTAAKYWLGNRRPEAWREKQEVEHSGSIALALAERLAGARARVGTILTGEAAPPAAGDGSGG